MKSNCKNDKIEAPPSPETRKDSPKKTKYSPENGQES